jgi:coenzyme F420-reducing hydrogenase gamma subunit
MKSRVAIVGFSCCEGCQVQFLNLGEELLDVLDVVDIVNFRLAKEENLAGPFNIAFIEGSVVTAEEVGKLKKVRESSEKLIALGTCACSGGVQSIKNFLPHAEVRRIVYGESELDYETAEEVHPIDDYVKVDYYVPGCPFDKKGFLTTFKQALLDKKPSLVDYNVCAECKLRENGCLLDEKIFCMGPVIRGGCDALCPTRNHPCEGCWGPSEDADERIRSFLEILREHGIPEKEIALKFRKYAGFMKPFKGIASGHPNR